MAYREIVLGSFFQVLFDKLSSLALNYVQEEGASTKLLKEWKRMLVKLDEVLDDAEEKQLCDNRLVKLWLDDVKDLAFDIEDLLNDIQMEAAQAKSEAESSTSRGQWKRKLSFFSQLRPLVSNTRVQDIKCRLEEIFNKEALLNLGENTADKSNNTNRRLPSTSLPEPHFLGREKEEAEILELLIGKAKNAASALSIVPIVGMGGVGKTAMTQRLFNNAEVKRCFKLRAWVCVSDIFNVFDITKTILQSITELSCGNKDLNWLQVKLQDNLSGNKFLVVLDDVWNEKGGEWEALLKPFAAGGTGSKIIVTTRNLSVVSLIGASPYHLKELSIGNCKSLLAFHALGATNFESHRGLETIGEELAEKCDGLPLAAKMLGSALRDERNPDKWEAILRNKMWDLSNGKKDEVLPVLKLSYVHLPSYLKRCFAYCAIFPKDYEFERDELVYSWIAEGFLDGRSAKEDTLRLGWDYFDELVSRSFLQQSSINTSKFSMHDLLNDLAKSIAGKTCFRSGDSQPTSDKNLASIEKARYASFFCSSYVTPKCLRGYGRMKVLRSLAFLFVGHSRGISISNKLLHDLLTNLKYLRVLSLCHCDITKVPNCVGDLKHLQYLNFSYTSIQRLPESIVGLCKLQALILRGCQHLCTLPQGITKLVSLQFIDIRDTSSLKEIPLGIGNLENLNILSKFVAGTNKGPRLKELKNLPHLQRELFISELQKVEEVRDVVDANLFGKQGLNNLSLHWDGCLGNLQNHEYKAQEQVLNFLRPHTNLENLTILNYGGAILPSWLGDGAYSKIVSLCLRGCLNVTSLPKLGQLPSLKKLSFEGLHAVRMIGSEFYGGKRPFPSLTTLEFEEMLAWKDWSPYAGDLEEGAPFSHLQHLVIQKCPSLVGTLPCRLEHLVKLEIRSCPHLNISNDATCLPSLCELYLEDCNKEILRSLVNPTSLTILNISNIAELVCFDPGLISCLVELKELHIEGCDQLRYLWQDENEILNLTCLLKLFIGGCPQFTSFMAEGGAIELPRNLDRMELRDCKSLEKLPSKVHTLRYLDIHKCPKLTLAVNSQDDVSNNNATSQIGCQQTLFPYAEGRLAIYIGLCEGVERLEEITVESLELLTIYRCENLRSLPQDVHMLSYLTQLEIFNCPFLEIEDFPSLPITLSSLRLAHCPRIKSIASCNITSCNNLTHLDIRDCPTLEIEEFPSLPITLSRLWLWGCPKIKSLPNQWHHLTSLLEISISYCPNIECFPKGGWPPNLEYLYIRRCENVKQPVREWGLRFLTSLQYLSIDGISMGGGGEKAWFPSDADADAWTLLFPSSLIYLCIEDMRKVERLSSGLRNHLSSLQLLFILYCPNLRDLPEDGLPPSLQRLSIYKCEKISKDRYSQLADEIPSLEVD